MVPNFFKTNFVFIANRYEEWQSGRCISQGQIQTEIVAEVIGDKINFELKNIGDIRILTSFGFENIDILPDRIQYTHGTSDFNPIVPIVCHIFYNGNTMQYVRFAMTNPDRIVEFYGSLTSLGQPSISRQKTNNGINSICAESILNELRSYGMEETGAIMERAVKIYNDNADIKNIEQAKRIIESLKLFIRAYQLDKKEHEGLGIKWSSIGKCKILMFIALCNYKIANINRAYCIAKQGIDAINDYIDNSPIIVPRSACGEDTMIELMDTIKKKHFDDIQNDDNYYKINPEEIDTTRFEAINSTRGRNLSSNDRNVLNKKFIATMLNNLRKK